MIDHWCDYTSWKNKWKADFIHNINNGLDVVLLWTLYLLFIALDWCNVKQGSSIQSYKSSCLPGIGKKSCWIMALVPLNVGGWGGAREESALARFMRGISVHLQASKVQHNLKTPGCINNCRCCWDATERKAAFHREGAAFLWSFYTAAGRWVFFFFFFFCRQLTDCLARFFSICLSAAQLVPCVLGERKKTQQSGSAAWLKVAQSNIDCLLFCHPALSLLQNKHSLVSLHRCLKSTFCVPFRHKRALRQLLSLLHKWNKSPLCKKWWGHGKKRMILLLHQDVIQIPGSL